MYRYRIFYHKLADIKYTSNLDLYKVWERSCRRAKLPLVYSQGFHPQPKINLACPLPLGIISYSELVDVWLQECFEPEVLRTSLSTAVPPGVKIQRIDLITASEPALQTTIAAARYHVSYQAEVDFSLVSQTLNSILAKDEVIRQRRNKKYDLRPLILDLRITQTENGTLEIDMLLSASEGKTGRPDEVLLELGLDPSLADIIRTELIRKQE